MSRSERIEDLARSFARNAQPKVIGLGIANTGPSQEGENYLADQFVRFVDALSEAPEPTDEPFIEWCEAHAETDKVPGGFCPACSQLEGSRAGVKAYKNAMSKAPNPKIYTRADVEARCRKAAEYAQRHPLHDLSAAVNFGMSAHALGDDT